MFFADVDVAKRRHKFCVIDSGWEMMLHSPVENSRKGLNKLLAAFETKHLRNECFYQNIKEIADLANVALMQLTAFPLEQRQFGHGGD